MIIITHKPQNETCFVGFEIVRNDKKLLMWVLHGQFDEENLKILFKFFIPGSSSNEESHKLHTIFTDSSTAGHVFRKGSTPKLYWLTDG